MDGLSVMDKEAVIQREQKGKNKGQIIYDKATRDIEIVKWDEPIFPRYHQLDLIRKLLEPVREHGTELNYLIEHSAGSGKTNSIAWLTYRLASLHDTQNRVIFNKSNVVSACLGIHIPFRVSNRMLQLAEIPIDLTLPGTKGEENGVYDQILHLNWAQDYSDTYDELKADHYEHLIH